MFNVIPYAFSLGVLIQTVFICRDKKSMKWFVAFFASMVFLFTFVNSAPFEDEVYRVVGVYLFVLIFFNLKNMIPSIGELTVLPYSLLFAYVYFIWAGDLMRYLPVSAAVVYMTFFCFWRAVIDRKNSKLTRAAITFWYITCVFFIGCAQLPDILSLFRDDLGTYDTFAAYSSGVVGVVDAFLSGMVLSFYGVHAVLFFYIIPGKRERNYGKRMEEYFNLLSKGFLNRQASVWQVFFVVVLVGGSIVVNHFFHLVYVDSLIKFWLILSPTLFYEKKIDDV